MCNYTGGTCEQLDFARVQYYGFERSLFLQVQREYVEVFMELVRPLLRNKAREMRER